ncbi:hypothetical protein Tco_0584373 [Tanacetum coccineum]
MSNVLGSEDWDLPEYKDTAGCGGKKEPEALVFHKMYTEEDSDRDEEGKPNLDELKTLLDFDFDEVLQTEIDLPPMRAPRVQRASMQDLYERMGSMEIRQEAIERMEYRHAYHWDRYQGVFEHMAGVYSVPLQGAYNPPGYYVSPSTTNTTSSTIRNSHYSSNMMMRRTSSVG